MHHLLPRHVIAAAGQRNPQLLPDLYQARVRYVVDRRDLLVRRQAREHLCRDVVERVLLLDGVDGLSVGDAGAVAAEAREGDPDGLIGGHRLVGGGREWKVIGAEDGAEVPDGEEGLYVGERGGVW
uniref:Uncharacterized protein n=1 Tax=Rhizophora mucronata TaxID=61149 RepID=A0A2P2PKR6_RHIMU